MRLPSSGPHLCGPALAALVRAAESNALGDLVYASFARTMGISDMLRAPVQQTCFANLDTIQPPIPGGKT